MKNFAGILVVSRMNSDSRDAVRFGVSLARKHDAKLLVLHLIANTVDMAGVYLPGRFPEEDIANYLKEQQEVKKQLAEVIKKEMKGGFPMKELVRDGDPVDEIVKLVGEEKVDLIVMLAHQEGRFEHALFGGENDAIIRKMPCSILLVKQEPEPVHW
jgi:nucleotide-binding universal stress UspA family protein